jgi:phosphoribosylglycinamide formyltransferase-1
MTAKCAVFASGGGSNFQSLIDRRDAGELKAQLSVLVVNNSGAGAAERARKSGIPVLHCAPSHFESATVYAETLLRHLDEYAIDCIVLAGYMKMLPSPLVQRFRNRIINIHPGLLPAFGGKGMYGANVHRAVLEYGAKISGITVHFVDEEYDHGPVIYQQTVPVLDDDTPESLAARVLAVEHASLWKVVNAVSVGSVRVEGRRVFGEV